MQKTEGIFSDLSQERLEESLYRLIDNALKEKYGKAPDDEIQSRVAHEWNAIKRHEAICDVAALYEISCWLKEKGHPYFMQHTAGSSLILYLLGITEGNPLLPHSYCPSCHAVYWKPLYPDGFDIPQDRCEDYTGTPIILDAPDLSVNLHCKADGTLLIHDGHNIPWQTLWGYDHSYLLFSISAPTSIYDDVLCYLSEHWLVHHTTKEYYDGVQEGYDNDVKKIGISRIKFVFDLHSDDISHDFYKHTCTYKDYESIMRNWRSLAASEADESFIMPEPNNIADVFSISGFLHSWGAWDDTAELMANKMMFDPSELIAFREDVFDYLLYHGYEEYDAWKGMEYVRKGQGMLSVTGKMLKARDRWVIDRCQKVQYLSAKAHSVEEVLFRLRAM